MKEKYSYIVKALFEILSSVVFTLTIVAFIFLFVCRLVTVNGNSMLPTLTDGDKIIISVGEKKYEYKDVVIIVQPGVLNEPLVKRVVATGGQWVDVDYDAGVVYVGNTAENLLPLEEDYILEPATEKNSDDTNEYPVFVPEGKLFVLGDNRNDSTDSRSYMVGLIDEDYVLGKVKIGIWSAGSGFGFNSFNK